MQGIRFISWQNIEIYILIFSYFPFARESKAVIYVTHSMENYETWLVSGIKISNPKLIFTECLTLCVYSFYIHYYSPQEFDRTWPLNAKLTKLILQIECPYYLTSWRKLALIQKPSSQIPKASIEQNMRFSIKDLFRKCDQICRKLRIWSLLLKKSLLETSFFVAVLAPAWKSWKDNDLGINALI